MSNSTFHTFYTIICTELQTSSVKMADSFVGRFVVESKDNYDGFMKGVGKSTNFFN